jgi:hypothetical protein
MMEMRFKMSKIEKEKEKEKEQEKEKEKERRNEGSYIESKNKVIPYPPSSDSLSSSIMVSHAEAQLGAISNTAVQSSRSSSLQGRERSKRGRAVRG